MTWTATTAWYLRVSLTACLLIIVPGDANPTSDLSAVRIEYVDRSTVMLHYNLTTNYSYYVTFRLFEHDQIRFGLFAATYRYQQRSLRISNQSEVLEEPFQLFIVCFHFLRQANDIDIQCKDIRSFRPNDTSSEQETLPTYKPLFVPLMYALSILMVLPMIVQHRRQKRALLLERRKQLRRLSLSIAPDNPDILSQIVENGKVNFKKIPIQIELVSLRSGNAIMDEIDDNDNITFTLQNLQPFRESISDDDDDDEGPGVTADDCIAHVLDSRPWHGYPVQQSPMISSVKREQKDVLKVQQIPIITILNTGEHDDTDEDDVNDDDRQPILKTTGHHTVELFRANPTFAETDV